jgi:hypothetical protein
MAEMDASTTTKERARKVIESMPEEASMDQIIHALYIEAKAAEGERQIRQGQGVRHEQAKQRLARWLM